VLNPLKRVQVCWATLPPAADRSHIQQPGQLQHPLGFSTGMQDLCPGAGTAMVALAVIFKDFDIFENFLR
jgi:hypothetical protein